MATRDVVDWETGICQVISNDDEEEIVIRGHRMSDLIGQVSFVDSMFLMLQGRLPEPNESKVLDALMVASIEHGIAPPSMVSRCYASYGTSLQVAIGGAVMAFGDRMGGLGEQLAELMVETLNAASTDPATLDDAQLQQLAADVVNRLHGAGERLPGYGIPLHAADPRAPAVLEAAREHGTHGVYCRFAAALGHALEEKRGGRPVPMNLDGVGAAVILDLGFPWQSTRMFLITARTVSAAAHFIEEREQDTTWRHIPSTNIRYTGPTPPARDGNGKP
jgi:citrate synthase